MKNRPRWRQMYHHLRKLTVRLVKNNLITAYPDKNSALLEVSALGIVEDHIRKIMKPKSKRSGK